MGSYIYLITNLINSKVYVGKSINPAGRWQDHKRFANGGREKHPKSFSAIHSAMKKYGIDNFKFEIIEEFDTTEESYLFETWWIDYFGSHIKNNFGYNLNYGGIGGGLGVTQETRNKIGKAHKGKILTAETKNKISIGHKGKVVSESVKKRMSENTTGELNPFYGKTHSLTTKDKISKSKIGQCSGDSHYLFNKSLPEETKRKISLTIIENGGSIGENNSASKTTEKIVLEIREKFNTGDYYQSELAIYYNLSTSIINRIIKRKTWKHI